MRRNLRSRVTCVSHVLHSIQTCLLLARAMLPFHWKLHFAQNFLTCKKCVDASSQNLSGRFICASCWKDSSSRRHIYVSNGSLRWEQICRGKVVFVKIMDSVVGEEAHGLPLVLCSNNALHLQQDVLSFKWSPHPFSDGFLTIHRLVLLLERISLFCTALCTDATTLKLILRNQLLISDYLDQKSFFCRGTFTGSLFS